MMAVDYKKSILSLFPKGEIWDEECRLNTPLIDLLSNFIEDLDYFLKSTLEQTNPLNALGGDLFGRWKTIFNIKTEKNSIAMMEAFILLSCSGHQSIRFYMDILARLGYRVQITEYLGLYKWKIVFLDRKYFYFCAGDPCGESLVYLEDDEVSDLLQKIKPAHTQLIIEGIRND